MRERLQDKTWLESELREKSVRQLGRELNIPFTTINGYVMRHGIDLAQLRNGKTPGLSQPGHPSTTKIVITKEDILREYINSDASLDRAAAALGCSIRPLWLAMKAHGITPKPRGRHGNSTNALERLNTLAKLHDKTWLEGELQHKTVSQIARELHTSNGRVSYYIKQNGIRAETYDRKVAVQDGLRKSYPEGRLGERASHWKGGTSLSSAGHVYRYAPDHPHATKRGYVMEHRLVMEEKLGRLLEPKEHVHHINGDKKDNRPENLEVMTPMEHSRTHFDAVKEVHRLKSILARYEALYGSLPGESTVPSRAGQTDVPPSQAHQLLLYGPLPDRPTMQEGSACT